MFCNLSYLRLAAKNYELSYEELLDLTNEIYPHQWCLHSLMTEVHKCHNGLSTDLMNDVLAVSDMVQIQFHIKLIRYGTYRHVN